MASEQCSLPKPDKYAHSPCRMSLCPLSSDDIMITTLLIILKFHLVSSVESCSASLGVGIFKSIGHCIGRSAHSRAIISGGGDCFKTRGADAGHCGYGFTRCHLQRDHYHVRALARSRL
jgi:hypothetical protein